MSDGDRGDSKNNKVIGPDDSKDEIWWLPSWLIKGAIPIVSGVDPKTRPNDVNKDQRYAYNCGQVFHVLRVLGLVMSYLISPFFQLFLEEWSVRSCSIPLCAN